MAIMLVVLQLVRNKLPSIRLSYYVTIFVTVCFSLVDSLKNLDILPEGLHQVMIHFPLYSQGLAWFVPALCTLVFSILLGKPFQITKMPTMICRHFLYQVRSFFHAFLGGKALSHNFK